LEKSFTFGINHPHGAGTTLFTPFQAPDRREEVYPSPIPANMEAFGQASSVRHGIIAAGLTGKRIRFRFLDHRPRTLQGILRASHDLLHLGPYFSCACLRRRSPVWKPRLIVHCSAPLGRKSSHRSRPTIAMNIWEAVLDAAS
jgi:hypothetical protein